MDIFVGHPRVAETDLVIEAVFEGDFSDLITEWAGPTGAFGATSPSLCGS